MNIPPTKRDEKISIIQKLSKEAAFASHLPPETAIANGYPTGNLNYPIGGFTLEELNKKLDSQLDHILHSFDCFREFYDNLAEKMRPFNAPDCKADFEYWSKQAYWSIDEGIALLLDKDPRQVTWKNISPYLSASRFVKKFHEIQELAKRYVTWNQLFDPVLPGIFLAWAKRMRIDISPDLQEAVSSIGIQIADWKGNYEKTVEQYNQLNKLYDEALGLIQAKEQIIEALSLRIANPDENQGQPKVDALKETERQSLYKLIAAMAYDGYGHNPLDKKSPLPKEISDAVTSYLGENIDPDTARKWLKKATSAHPNQLLSKTE